jgi:metal-sulfur cluster biosynthetic enzyme
MSTYSLQLLDFPCNYDKGTMPYGPRAFIALKTSSEVKWCDKTGKKKIDFTVITPECVSVSEFKYHVKRLIKELETINKQADKFFRRDAEKRSSMSSKKA